MWARSSLLLADWWDYPARVRRPPLMVFHHPGPIDDDPKVGSSQRVTQMAQAFRDEGFDVELVAGFSSQRRRSAKRVRRLVRSGRRVEFVYSEATTNPTAMNDPHHLPLRPLLDLGFFLFMRRHGVPIGLFYRDVHWQFGFYRVLVPRLKRWVARLFYVADLWWYRLALDVMFLPSLSMAEYLPGWRDAHRVVELPPASMGPRETANSTSNGGELKLFYVGSIAPPLYDISELIEVVAATPGVSLTVCCPTSQAGLVPAVAASPRINVVHEHGAALAAHYEHSDIACLVYPNHPYRDFAMPVKLFEALGFARPVLVAGGREVDRFVEATGCGWVVAPGQLQSTLVRLRDDDAMRNEARRRAIAVAEENTWGARAACAASVLTSLRRAPCDDDAESRV